MSTFTSEIIVKSLYLFILQRISVNMQIFSDEILYFYSPTAAELQNISIIKDVYDVKVIYESARKINNIPEIP